MQDADDGDSVVRLQIVNDVAFNRKTHQASGKLCPVATQMRMRCQPLEAGLKGGKVLEVLSRAPALLRVIAQREQIVLRPLGQLEARHEPLVGALAQGGKGRRAVNHASSLDIIEPKADFAAKARKPEVLKLPVLGN
jgi:hypothetical protein